MTATLPTPHPALRELDRFIGTWEMSGSLVGSDEKTIVGRASYRWLPGGFFLEQRVQLDFAGFVQVDSTELIGYDPESDTYPSRVYSNMSPEALPYTWSVDGDNVRITVQHGPMDATFEGKWTGEAFAGGWRPNPGADEAINVPYDVSGSRVS